MSRARPITLGDEQIWFDTAKNGERAKPQHLELLALVEEIDIDDLLDEHIVQGTVIQRLRDALGQNTIPEEILQRREAWREARHKAEPCRLCGAKGDSTKHHFVNRWILKELVDYAWRWSPRARNCIPVCLECHRNLHERTGEAKSIVPFLKDDEKAFAEEALEALSKERPAVVILLARGDDSVYESRLLKDWINGEFKPTEPERITPGTLRRELVSAEVVSSPAA